MGGFSFRYSWIAPETLFGFFPRSPFIANLKQLDEERRALLATADSQSAGGLQRIRLWAKHPLWRERIGYKTLNRIRDQALEQDRPWVSWARRVYESLLDSEPSQSPPYEEMHQFLGCLCQSDFPQLLLWSQRRFAKRLFVWDSGGIVLNQSYLNKKRKLVQSAHSCIRFAAGAVGRLAPRQAWVGVGFGRFTMDGSSCCHIDKKNEMLVIEPDLAWINRNWRELAPRPLLPGETAWVYLENRINAQTNEQIRSRFQTYLFDMQQACHELREKLWDFRAIDAFLASMDEYLRSTVEQQVWQRDPHSWWLSRMPLEEIIISAEQQQPLMQCYGAYQAKLARLGLINADDHPPSNRPPIAYPLRVQLEQRRRVIATAEEFIHWLLLGETRTPKPWLPSQLFKQFAYVFWQDIAGCSFQFVEPNPHRCVERFAALRPQKPAYINSKSRPVGLAPPTSLLDNRLIRLDGNEIERTNCKPGDAVMFYSTLFTEQTQPLFNLELQSTIYRQAPDLIPLTITDTRASKLSFGRLDTEQRLWYIQPQQIPIFLRHIHNAKQAAIWYYWEIHDALGSPDWLTLVVDGKPTQLPTHSLLAFDHMLHLLRTVKTPLIMTNPQRMENHSIIRDAEGNSLAAQLLVYL